MVWTSYTTILSEILTCITMHNAGYWWWLTVWSDKSLLVRTKSPCRRWDRLALVLVFALGAFLFSVISKWSARFRGHERHSGRPARTTIKAFLHLHSSSWIDVMLLADHSSNRGRARVRTNVVEHTVHQKRTQVWFQFPAEIPTEYKNYMSKLP